MTDCARARTGIGPQVEPALDVFAHGLAVDASGGDTIHSGIMDVLIESCPTKIFLPNETAAGSPIR